MVVMVSKTDLARRTRQVVEIARRQSPVVVESFGEELVAIVDAVDYRLLRALARCQGAPAGTTGVPAGLETAQVRQAVDQAGGDVQPAWDVIVRALLEGEISVGRAAALLGLPRFELERSLRRVGARLPLGPVDADEALDDGRTAEGLGEE